MTAININKNNFQSEVMNSDKPVLLDFWAPWCAPCRMVVPIIEEIAGERPDIRVGKINVDEQPELASEFSIMSIPTLVVMKNWKIVLRAKSSPAGLCSARQNRMPRAPKSVLFTTNC